MKRSLVTTVGALVASGMLLAAGCAQTDAGLTTAVKTKFAADDTVKAYKIDVDTNEGVVTLNGSVDSEAARSQALQLARATDGVRDVVDNLKIEPAAAPTTGISPMPRGDAPPLPAEPGVPPYGTERFPEEPGTPTGERFDASITTEVKGKLLADTDVAGLRIDVETRNGVVTLNGEVKSANKKQEALRLAREVTGVKRVIDKLTVKES